MGFSVDASLRGRLMTALLVCLLPASLACADGQEPEKTENQENSAEARSDEPAAPQPLAELERRAAAAEETLAPLRKDVAENPGDASRHAILGRALIDAHYMEEAVAHYETAAELDPEYRRLLDLGRAYELAARLEEAVEVYEMVLEAVPDLPAALYNLGKLAHRRGEYERAVGLFQRVLVREPGHMQAQLHLGDSLRSIGRNREAYRAYEKVLAIEPTNARDAGAFVEALYELSALDLMMGAHDRAKQFLEEILRLSPEHDKAYYAYGQVMLHLGQPEKAQQAFAKHAEILAAREPTSGAAMGE